MVDSFLASSVTYSLHGWLDGWLYRGLHREASSSFQRCAAKPLSTMLKLGSVRFRGKCARHPKFNPARDGLAAIKGGCPKCHLLLSIFETHRRLIELMRQAVPPRESATKLPAVNTAQLGLFSGVSDAASASSNPK